MSIYKEPVKDVKVREEYDVVVCGGGPAGIAAAVSAARSGAKTCLIEVKGCLGGVWTAGLLAWIIDQHEKTGIMQEIREAVVPHISEKYDGKGSLPFDVEHMKFLLEDMCLEAGVNVRYHTRITACAKEEDNIKYVITESKSGREAWPAKVFIDCTGDGDLGWHAGCSFDIGQPETGNTQPMSMLCLVTGLDIDEVGKYTNGFTKDWAENKNNLREAMTGDDGVEPSYGFPTMFHIADDLFMIMANHQYCVSALNADDVTKATLNARREINHQINVLKNLGGCWKNIKLVATGEQIGTREGRRIKGEYQVNLNDLITGARFEDSVCRSTFCIDVHALDPKKEKGIESCEHKVKPYDIPLRSLKSAEVKNLMMAGRCISGDFFAHASYRVTGNAVQMGEGAGKAAAARCK